MSVGKLMGVYLWQVLPHFGPYKKQRDELESEQKKSDPMLGQDNEWSSKDSSRANVTSFQTIYNVIGESLPRIGAYKNLDQGQQVVALINDVSVSL